ncbi:hydroxypyruvate reductase [Microplitis mediator]|uniref:hydroxypyruvate reductase n=1 Tax=Microplitis mediator TaxID=375433 RepID=UPI00255536D8|nr:hydroxypyruvate reductase [Microplitis mediator]
MSIKLRSVFISDPVDSSCADLLTSHGVPVTTKYKLTKDELIKELQNHDGLIVRSETKVTPEILSAVPNLRIIGRAGTGVDNIDLQTATRHGIVVLNTPGGNSISACELTCAFISALARNVPQAAQSMKEGRWDRKLYSGFELSDKTLAVLGFGRIGRDVALRMQSYGMKIICFDPMLSAEATASVGATKLNLEEIWPIADYITVHTPLIPQTRNLINANTLAKCKKGVRIINVARGGIVDEEALLQSIKSGHCSGAALDVFTEEPPKNPTTLELIKHPHVIATPHLGASTEEAQKRVAVEIAEQFLAISGKSDKYTVTGIVNAPILSAATSDENRSWIELSKKLGRLGARFLKKTTNQRLSSVPVESQTVGMGMLAKKFVHTAVLVGLLEGQTKNGLNLVNAPMLAKDVGVEVKESHIDGEVDAVVVKVGPHQVKGTVRNNDHVLLSIDNNTFENGIILRNYMSFYRSTGPEGLVNIVNTFSSKSVIINSINANGNWLAIETNEDVTIPVENMENL